MRGGEERVTEGEMVAEKRVKSPMFEGEGYHMSPGNQQ